MRNLLIVVRNLLIPVLLLICTSCTTTKFVEKPVPVETVRTEYINQLYRDSVFVHDSIDRYIQGDTIYQYKYKYIYKYMNRTDTIVRTDSIEVPVEVKVTEVKEVNRVRWYQSFLMYFGFGFILVLLYKGGKLCNTVFSRSKQ